MSDFFGFVITPCNILEAKSDGADFGEASEATFTDSNDLGDSAVCSNVLGQQTTLPRPLTSDLTYPKPSSDSADIRQATLSSSKPHLSGSDRHCNDGLRR